MKKIYYWKVKISQYFSITKYIADQKIGNNEKLRKNYFEI
jgi:hypothetical protein